MQWVFWLSLILIIYSYALYPFLLAILSFFNKLLSGKPRVPKKVPDRVSVSLVLVVDHDEPRVLERIENLLQSDYEKVVEVLVITGRGSTEKSEADGDVKDGGIGQWVREVELERGKDGRAAALNQAVAIAKGEVVVFADVGQRFASDTVSHLVAPFVDKKVGAVTGWLEPGQADGGAAESAVSLDVFRELEKIVLEKESDLASTVFCQRVVYAVRGDAYEAIDEDVLDDGLIVPMKIILGGHRVLFAPQAKAYQLEAADSGSQMEEIKKEAQLVAGQWQVMFRYLVWMFPWVNRLAWQLISHVYLRLLGPVLLLVLLLSNMLLLNTSWFYWLVFLLQLAAYGLAASGCFKVTFPWAFASFLSKAAGGFVALQALNFLALLHWLKGQLARINNPNSEPRMTKIR